MSYCSNEYACVHAYFLISNPSLLCSTHPTPYHSSAGEDYRPLDTDVTFSPRQNSYTFSVQINPDEKPEFPEEFYIDLTIPPDAETRGVRLVTDTARVVIKDDDSECDSNIQTLHTVTYQ